MKKIIFSTSLLTILFATSCLKDKRFDDGKNGILNTEVKGVALPQAKGLIPGMKAADSASITSTITSQTTPQVINDVIISIEAIDRPATDVRVKVVLTPSLVSTAFAQFPAGSVTVPAEVVIPAGAANAKIPVTFPNSSTLNSSLVYALGLTLTSVDGGYIIAGNKRQILVAYSIKNAYAADYDSRGYFYHPTAPREIDREATLTTINANSCRTNLGDLSNPISITVDASNNVTIADLAGNVGTGPTGVLSALPSAFSPFAGSNPAIYTNKYDPVTKTFFLRFGYLGATGFRVIEQTLVRH